MKKKKKTAKHPATERILKKARKGLEIPKSLWYYNRVLKKCADIAQSVERILGKDEVTGSNPVISSKSLETLCFRAFCFI